MRWDRVNWAIAFECWFVNTKDSIFWEGWIQEYTFLLQQNNLNSAWHNLGPLHIFWATHKSRVFACYLGASFLSIKCCHSNAHDVFEFNILKYQVVMYTWTVSFIHQTRCSSNRISCLLGSHRNIKSGSSFFVEITAFLR